MKKKNETNKKSCDFHNTKMEKKNVDFNFKCLKIDLKFIRKRQQPDQASQQITESRVIDLHVLCTFRSNHQVLC